MKTHPFASQFLTGAALILVTSLALPSAFADRGSGVTIWRNTDKADSLTGLSHERDRGTAVRACADPHLTLVTETRWTRTGGRGPTPAAIGNKLICTSCAETPVAHVPTDRNAHGPKASWRTKSAHDCTKGGCGQRLASTN